MSPTPPDGANRVFVSYRRDDAAGYAGRIEEALERRFGHGTVFRDVLDIAPGEDFVAAIRNRLAGAKTVLVLIGPRWAGGDAAEAAAGTRRIDDPADFVRLEVAMALDSGMQVLPVLLPGATMPSESSLPDVLKPLARRNAMAIGDTHWQADIDRLAAAIGLAPRRRIWPWALGSALLAAALVGAWCWWHQASDATAPTAVEPDAGAALLGTWQANVRYDWGDRYDETFVFKRHAGELTGTASFLKYPRAIEKLRLDGNNLHFETRSVETMGESNKEVTRSYAAEVSGQPPDQMLVFRMQSSGGHGSSKPIEFEARRAAAGLPAASTPTR
jgi:hypothetical protein